MINVIFSGKTASGKDEMIKALIKKFSDEGRVHAEYAWYYTTRTELRKGEGEKEIPHQLSEADFDKMLEKGEISFHAQNNNYRVGYPKIDVNRKGVIFYNIMPSAARTIQRLSDQNNQKSLLIYLHAPERQRSERLRFREGYVIYEPGDEKMKNDIVKGEVSDYADFDLVLENKDGDFEKNVEIIYDKINTMI